MNTPAPKTLLTLREQAAALSISWRHLQNLARARAIPSVRLGRRILFSPPAVERAIEKLTIREIG
jgi:excisionase family DNA binding protein